MLSTLLLLSLSQPPAERPDPDHPPVEPPPPPTVAELNRGLIVNIEDDVPIRNELENPDEYLAYDYLVRFARRVPVEELQRQARLRITPGHLLSREAYKYRGELVRVHGILHRLRDIGSTPALETDGITSLYEGWIFSPLYGQSAVCVVFTELPPDVPVAEDQRLPVSFEGFFFKRLGFTDAEQKRRRAPVLIGRTIRAVPRPPVAPSPWAPLADTLPYVIGTLTALTAGLVAVVWWMRRDDGRTRRRLRELRGEPDAPDFGKPGGPTFSDPMWN